MSNLRLNDRLTWSRHYHIERVSDDLAVLVGARDHYVVRGRSRVEALALIDESCSVDALLAKREEASCEIQTYETFDQLLQAGICELVPQTNNAQTEEKLGGPLAAAWLEAALRRELPLRTESGEDIEQVVVGDYLDLRTKTQAEHYHDAGITWLAIDPFGVQPWLGPVFSQQPGPCWSCVRYWVALNRPARVWRRRLHRDQRGVHTKPATDVVAIDRFAQQWLRCMEQIVAAPLRNHIIEVDLDGEFSAQRHRVFRRPQCPTCGDPGLRARNAATAFRLREHAVEVRMDRGYRVESPSRSYASLADHVSPLTGAVCELLPVECMSTPSIHVFRSRHRLTPWSHDSELAFSYRCWGKGPSRAQARSSALGEALERFAGVYEGDEAVLHTSLAELHGQAIAPQALQLFSSRQLQSAQMDRKPEDTRAWQARALPESKAIHWTPAFRLRDDSRYYVPFCYCYTNTPQWPDLTYCRYVSNGSAAGRCPEEAILQGLFELIERDAISLWWHNRISHPAVDLAAFDLDLFRRIQTEYQAQGRQFWVLDLTQDFEIPVCAALAHDPDQGRYAIGFGCHLQPELAVRRAITELAQMSVILNRDYTPWDATDLGSEQWLFPNLYRESPLTPQFGPACTGILEAIEVVCGKLEAAGLETFVVNKSRPDIELSVVQVLVPGLRHFWPRLGPGRLYDVPYQLGWTDKKLSERDMNPALLRV